MNRLAASTTVPADGTGLCGIRVIKSSTRANCWRLSRSTSRRPSASISRMQNVWCTTWLGLRSTTSTTRSAWRMRWPAPYEQPFPRCEWWRFRRADGQPWGLAGLWSVWTDKATGDAHESYTMLTLNADAHPLMGRMHKPEVDPKTKQKLPLERQDKRSVIPIEGRFRSVAGGNRRAGAAAAQARAGRALRCRPGAARSAKAAEATARAGPAQDAARGRTTLTLLAPGGVDAGWS